MKCVKKIGLLLFLCLQPWVSLGQIKDIGIPSVVNYSRISSSSGTQNWDITQSRTGFIYFGNNDGILEYDGTSWNIYPVSNASVVRSVHAVGDKIYAGAFEDFGYLAPDDTGSLAWHSLTHLVPEKYSRFADIWHIFSIGESILFQSFDYVFIYEDNEISVIEPPSALSIMYDAGDRLYVADSDHGFLIFEDDTFRLLSDHPVFFRNEVRFVIPYTNNGLLIGTSNEGVFLWNGQNMEPWNTPVNTLLTEDNLYSGIRLSHGDYVFGTIRDGLYLADENGGILQHMNRFRGLQNNTVLSLFEDRRNNLWLGLDNGIDYIEASSPLTFLNYNYNIESTYTSIVHNDVLYVGTNQGLYAGRIDELRNPLHIGEIFTLVEGTEGQVWNLEIIDDKLLCGHNFGAFQIEGMQANKISDIRGYWSFLQPPGVGDTLIAGTYTGLVRFVKKEDNWLFDKVVEGFEESARGLYMDSDNNLWTAHGYRGLYKLQPDADFGEIERIRFFYGEMGLPDALPYNIQSIDNNMYISTVDGIYIYDYSTGAFSDQNRLSDLFGEKTMVEKIQQDNNGNLWYFTDEYLGVMRLLEDGSYRDIVAPFFGLTDYFIPAFNNILIHDRQHIFIGSQNGLVHYDPNVIKDYNSTEELIFQEVLFYGKREPVSFRYFHDQLTDSPENELRMPFGLNSVLFRYTFPAFEDPQKLSFSYRLKGLEENWSEWNTLNIKEYTNLREGDYIFEIKARNAFGVESEVKSFHFAVAPPFFRSILAYVIYSSLILLIIAVNFYYIRKRILRIRIREKLRHEKRLARREQIFQEKSALSEKEIMNLRNESLQSEMRHKNQELANATLHLIQKNKILTKLKEELSKVLQSMPSDNPEKHSIMKLRKVINRDLRNEQNWELFNSYFDEVHQDFMNRLKAQYGDLTPKELRLCAYLRMNLSTKEIAPLMNISIRGVEISRYRLRKKLRLNHYENLADFLMSF